MAAKGELRAGIMVIGALLESFTLGQDWTCCRNCTGRGWCEAGTLHFNLPHGRFLVEVNVAVGQFLDLGAAGI